jgi:hypothetical protein
MSDFKDTRGSKLYHDYSSHDPVRFRPQKVDAISAQRPHTGRTAPCPRVRALCAAVPARSPLLPAKTYSLRAASVFPTSPPPLDGM